VLRVPRANTLVRVLVPHAHLCSLLAGQRHSKPRIALRCSETKVLFVGGAQSVGHLQQPLHSFAQTEECIRCVVRWLSARPHYRLSAVAAPRICKPAQDRRDRDECAQS
jgi:hypothetical protein